MKVVSKQTNSKMCLICGLNNHFGLKANFYNMEDDSVGAIFTFKPEHQSYPERVHGGMISALLDELAGRALWVKNPELLGVTTTMPVKFRKPVPYNTELTGSGKITKQNGRLFTAESKIFDKNKNLLAELCGNYIVLPNSEIASTENLNEDISIMVEDNITEIDI